jgi:Flp pilus assembly protein TadB
VVLPTSACSILSSQLNHCGVPTFNLFALLVSCSSVLSFFFVGVLCAIVVSCRLRFICSSCSCCSSSCDVFFGVLVVAAAATATAPHSASNQTTCVFSRVVSPSVLVSIDISCSGYSVRQSLHHPSTSTTALLSTRVFLCFLLRGCLFCVLLLRGCAVRRRGLMLLAVLSLFVLFLLFFAWCLLWSAARRRRRRRHHRPSLLRFVHPSRSVECIRVIVFISTSACQTFPVQPLWGTARTNHHHPSTIVGYSAHQPSPSINHHHRAAIDSSCSVLFLLRGFVVRRRGLVLPALALLVCFYLFFFIAWCLLSSARRRRRRSPSLPAR